MYTTYMNPLSSLNFTSILVNPDMIKLYFFILVLVVVAVLIRIVRKGLQFKNTYPISNEYEYKRKKFFMSAPEHEFFDLLYRAVGDKYRIFAQVHLPTLVDHKIPGQDWRGAFRHIDEKSVDFVLCDKSYIAPLLAIELDDSTHEREDRQERDSVVENILSHAGLPLLRIRKGSGYDITRLIAEIEEMMIIHN